jgi:uncharacterized protein YndB with AHSA1/START domain
MTATAGDVATVTVFVAVSPEAAFEVFTKETDLWWGRGPKYRIAGRAPSRIAFEGGLGGRLFETFESGSESRMFVSGTIRAWEPPQRLQFEWRGVNFQEGESTLVEVTFEPAGDGTQVTVRHYGWSALPAEHPVRHGLNGAAFLRVIGLWWGGLMTFFRERTEERSSHQLP